MLLNIVKKSMKGPVKIFFGQSKIHVLKSRGFRAAGLSTYDFSTLYSTLPHNLIKDKLVDLFESIFEREGSLYIACNDKHAVDRRLVTDPFWVVLGRAYHGLTGWFLLFQNFSVPISVSPHVFFYLSFNIDFYVSKTIHL